MAGRMSKRLMKGATLKIETNNERDCDTLNCIFLKKILIEGVDHEGLPLLIYHNIYLSGIFPEDTLEGFILSKSKDWAGKK